MHLVTKKSLENLKLGRQKGTNHLLGISKTKSHKKNMSRIMKDWCKNNPDKVKARGEKMRGANHYLWKGGETILNKSLRRMTENIYWQRAVKKRDKKCKNQQTQDCWDSENKPLEGVKQDFCGHFRDKNASSAPMLMDFPRRQSMIR